MKDSQPTATLTDYSPDSSSFASSPTLLSAESSSDCDALFLVSKRLDELDQTLNTMPDPRVIKSHGNIMRAKLRADHLTKDWRKIPFDEVRQFLHYLFSDDPGKNGYGITVTKKKDKWHISFNGRITIHHDLIDGQSKFAGKYSQEDIKRLTVELEATQRVKASLVSTVKKSEKARSKATRLGDLLAEIKQLDKEIARGKKEIAKGKKELKQLKQQLKPNNHDT
jgi:hypothetical protein